MKKVSEGNVVASIAAIGMDVGDRHVYICGVDADGGIVHESRMATTPRELEVFFTGRPRTRVLLEVGVHSPWISRLLERLGHEVIVANARRLRLIAETDQKTDRMDARTLAELARTHSKLIKVVHHRSEQSQADLVFLRSRELLVRTRTKLVNHVRGSLKSFGIRPPACEAKCFFKRVRMVIPQLLQDALKPAVDELAFIDSLLRSADRKLGEIAAERYPQTAVLRHVDRVGPVTSLAYVVTIEDPRRFRRSRMVGAYVGLTPKQRDSGKTRSQLSITKAGNTMLRSLLVQCAQQTLSKFGEDSDLRRHGLAICARGGANAKKRAVIATARKLAVLLHRLWVTGLVYDPLFKAKQLQAVAPAA
jgi:transposase